MGNPALSVAARAVPPPGGDDLARLLETEARLAAALEAARMEAAVLVAAARERAAAAEAGLAAELETAQRALEESVAADRDRRCAEIAAASRARVATLDAVTGPALERLADAVVAALLGGPA